jgi:hypothetical protein
MIVRAFGCFGVQNPGEHYEKRGQALALQRLASCGAAIILDGMIDPTRSNPKELSMRRMIYIPVLTMLFILAASVSRAQSFKEDGHALLTKPAPKKPDAAMEKVRALGEHLGRALDIALDLFSGNQADLLSKNKTALLSGNSPKLLSGNSPNLLSGNAPKVLSENQTPIFSGNKISLFSNFKVEIHIENSGNGAAMPSVVRPVPSVYGPGAGSRGAPRSSREIEQPSSRTYAPPGIPSDKPQ